MKSVNDAARNNEIIVDVAATHFNPDEVQNAAGLAGMLQGSPCKPTTLCDFIVDGEAELSLKVEK